MRNRIAKSLRTIVVAGAVCAIAAAVSYAAVPSANGTIEACYVKSGKKEGQLRVIDVEAGKNCKATEGSLAWNQQGPPGLADVEVVSDSTAANFGELKELFVKCPVGKRAIGGGGWAKNHFVVTSALYDGLQIARSIPDLAEYQYGWRVTAKTDHPDYQWVLGAEVVCAKVDS